jgi:type IV secretory pathway TrbL component
MVGKATPPRSHAADEKAGLFKPVAIPAVKAAMSIKGRCNSARSDEVTSGSKKLPNERPPGPIAPQEQGKPLKRPK